MSESLRMLHHHISERAQVVICSPAIILLAGESVQAQQHIGSNTVAGWGRIVHDIFGTTNQGLGIAARIKKAAILLIRKQFDSLIHQTARLREPAWVKSRLVYCQ